MPLFRVTYIECRERECYLDATSADEARRLVLEDECEYGDDFETRVLAVQEMKRKPIGVSQDFRLIFPEE